MSSVSILRLEFPFRRFVARLASLSILNLNCVVERETKVWVQKAKNRRVPFKGVISGALNFSSDLRYYQLCRRSHLDVTFATYVTACLNRLTSDGRILAQSVLTTDHNTPAHMAVMGAAALYG
jgi:hypothetical protein